MNITPQTSVRDVVVANPALARVFEKLGVDYCCGGRATLAEASVSAAIPLELLLSRLAQAGESTATPEELAIAAMDAATLVDHIENKHHSFTRSELARADDLMRKVLAAHGARHENLKELSQTLEDLTHELAVHLQKEERVLFPYLRALSTAARRGESMARPPFHSAKNPISVMLEEHDAAGIYLRRLRELSSGWEVPDGACGTFRALYESLSSLERDLHQHIHLENNVLFARAFELERQVFAAR